MATVKMKKLVRSVTGNVPVVRRDAVRDTGQDIWEQLEQCVQRGRGEELLSILREGDRRTSLLRAEYTRSGRTIDFSGKIRINLVHLAVLERKPAVLAMLLSDLDTEILTECVTEQVVTLDQERILPNKRENEESKRMFTVAGKEGANISVISCQGSEVDWRHTYQWNTIHLAVKHDAECLKVLLYLVEQRLDPKSLSDLLHSRDSKGRTALHLAAANPSSSTPTKLLLDCGASVDSLDNYLVSPLHVASRLGTVDTARELLEHGADGSGPQLDVMGRSALHYANSPCMVSFLLNSDYSPSLDVLTRQLVISPDNARAVLSTCLRCDEREHLVVLDLSLVMEGEAGLESRCGETREDKEATFLRKFIGHKELLQDPVVEAVLLMKWYQSRRILIFDLILYMLFICGMTAVILYSTKPLEMEDSPLQEEEVALVTMVLTRYQKELARRGWYKVTNDTSSVTASSSAFHPVVAANTAWDPKYEDGLTNSAGRPLLLPFTGFLALFYTTVLLFFLFILRELLELIAEGPKRYFSFFENIFEVFIVVLTSFCFIFLDDYSENEYFYQLLQVMTVFFGWLGLTLQLAKFPAVGMYIHLSIMVFRQLVLSLLVFMTILLAFSFSFHLALRKHNVFDNALTSFLKSINMMVGEFNFDYDFTFEAVRSVGGSNGLVQALLMLFILMVTVTIANLIIAIIIENISKMFERAEAHQLGKTVDQIATVHNVKQTLLRCIPCLRRVFSSTLTETLGQHPLLCVNTTESISTQGLNAVESWFRSGSDSFHPVYTYHEVYRKKMEQTHFFLPTRIVTKAEVLARKGPGFMTTGSGLSPGSSSDYTPHWRKLLGNTVIMDSSHTLLED